MAVIDEEGRVFGLINVVDLLVAALVLAAVVGGVVLVTGDSSENRETVFLEVRTEGAQPYVVEALPEEGTTLSVDQRGGQATVRIVDKSVAPTEVVVADRNGELHVRDHPRLQTVEVGLVAELEREGRLRLGGQRVAVGRPLVLDWGTVTIEGNVTRIEREYTR